MTTTGNRRRSALHNISLTRKEDWAKFVNAKPRTKPATLSRNQIVHYPTPL